MVKKTIFVFLTITFGVTITVIITARLMGFTLFGASLLYSQLTITVGKNKSYGDLGCCLGSLAYSHDSDFGFSYGAQA